MQPDELKLDQDRHRVFQALLELHPNLGEVTLHMENTPIRVLGERTLLEVIRNGEADKALRYLQSISGGQNG